MSALGVQVPWPHCPGMCAFGTPYLSLNPSVLSLFPQLWLLFLLPDTWQFLLRRHATLRIPKQELKPSPMCISQLSQFSCGTAEVKPPVQPRVPARQCWHLSLEISVAPCCCPGTSSMEQLAGAQFPLAEISAASKKKEAPKGLLTPLQGSPAFLSGRRGSINVWLHFCLSKRKKLLSSIKVGIQDTKQLLCCGLLRNLRKENTCLKFPTKLVNLKAPVCEKKRIKKFPVCCKALWSSIQV